MAKAFHLILGVGLLPASWFSFLIVKGPGWYYLIEKFVSWSKIHSSVSPVYLGTALIILQIVIIGLVAGLLSYFLQTRVDVSERRQRVQLFMMAYTVTSIICAIPIVFFGMLFT